MRATLRRKVNEATRLFSGPTEFSRQGQIVRCRSVTQRSRGSIVPARGPLEGSILGVEAMTDGKRYARLVAFSTVKAGDLCENSLMFVPFLPDTPAIESLLYLEPALRGQVRSVVVYETWNTMKDSRFREKLTVEDISAVISPISWRLPIISPGKLSVKICAGVQELLSDAPGYYGTSAQIFRDETSLGTYDAEFAHVVASGIVATGTAVTHLVYSHYAGTEIRLLAEFHDRAIHPRRTRQRV